MRIEMNDNFYYCVSFIEFDKKVVRIKSRSNIIRKSNIQKNLKNHQIQNFSHKTFGGISMHDQLEKETEDSTT